MVFKRILLGALIAACGCGSGAPTAKPDPPLDDAKKIELAAKNLESTDPIQRGIAVGTLGMFGSAAKEHLGALKNLQKSEKDPEIRKRIVEAIQKVESGS